MCLCLYVFMFLCMEVDLSLVSSIVLCVGVHMCMFVNVSEY